MSEHQTEFDVFWGSEKPMSRITAFFKANPFRAMAYVMTGIAVLALLSRVTGFYSLFG